MLINCSECGKQVSDKAARCPNCGNPIATAAKDMNESPNRQNQFFERIERLERERSERELNKSNKSRVVFVLLAICLGWLGIHNFYIGRSSKGIKQIIMAIFGLVLCVVGGIGMIFFFILTIWAIVDICSTKTDADGKILS